MVSMAETTFSELGRIGAIRNLFEGSPYKAFDDLSLAAQAGEQILSCSKLLLEGIDFDLVYFPLKHLGYKSVVAVTGELYAGMASPETLSVVLGVSAKLDYSQISELWQGMLAACTEHGFKKIALDLQPSQNGLSISLSACGRISAETVSNRPSPKTRDLVCVTGRLGAAYLGQMLLEKEKLRFDSGASERSEELEKNKMLVAAYLKPELPQNLPARLQEAGMLPSAGCLVNRGLADAALRLSRQTGLGVKIYAEKIPFEGNSFAVGKELDIDPVSAAMNGGDDLQLLFTIPILQAEEFRKEFQTFDIIGHLALSEAGTVLVLPTGVEMPLTAQGWSD